MLVLFFDLRHRPQDGRLPGHHGALPRPRCCCHFPSGWRISTALRQGRPVSSFGAASGGRSSFAFHPVRSREPEWPRWLLLLVIRAARRDRVRRGGPHGLVHAGRRRRRGRPRLRRAPRGHLQRRVHVPAQARPAAWRWRSPCSCWAWWASCRTGEQNDAGGPRHDPDASSPLAPGVLPGCCRSGSHAATRSPGSATRSIRARLEARDAVGLSGWPSPPRANASSGWRMVGVAFLVDFIAVGFFFYSFGVYYPEIVAELRKARPCWVAMPGSRFPTSVSGFVRAFHRAAPSIATRMKRMMLLGAVTVSTGFAAACRSVTQLLAVLPGARQLLRLRPGPDGGDGLVEAGGQLVHGQKRGTALGHRHHGCLALRPGDARRWRPGSISVVGWRGGFAAVLRVRNPGDRGAGSGAGWS